VTPVRAGDLPPPGGSDDGRRVGEALRQQPDEHERRAEAFGLRDVARSLDKRREARVRHGVSVGGERADGDLPDGSLAVVREHDLVGAHQKGAAREGHHGVALGVRDPTGSGVGHGGGNLRPAGAPLGRTAGRSR
jgi:hypothetical protein